MMLVLPLPFGPVMAVKPLSRFTFTVCGPKDLKPFNSILLMYGNLVLYPHLAACFNLTCHHRMYKSLFEPESLMCINKKPLIQHPTYAPQQVKEEP